MLRIELAFPESGWSDVRIQGNESSIACRISYLSDGLGDLVRAFHDILIHGRAVMAELEGEGHQSLIVLHTSGRCVDDPIELCVLSGLAETHPEELLPDLSRRRATFFVATRREFGREVVRAIETMLEGRTPAEYYQAWALPSHDEDWRDPSDVYAQARWLRMRFPEAEYRDIKAAFDNVSTVEES